MRPVGRRALAVVALVVPACAHLPAEPCDAPPAAPRQVVYVADGAGDYRSASHAMRRTARADGLPLEVITFVWSHGYLRNLADHTDTEWARDQGRELAGRVLALRQSRPDLPVSLVGHSAGAGVVLAAAEQLPPDTLERVVLLAASVSSDYDVRPALRATRAGIDNFYSPRDKFWLGAFILLLGTTDDPFETRSAGRYGFEGLPPDAAAKVRQYQWNPTLRPTGHTGGHFGGYQPDHLRRFVLPLFLE